MKRHIIIAALLLLALPMSAQTAVDLEPEFGARISLSGDKKIVRGLHISLEEEVRFDDNFTDLNRLQTTLGLSYKIHPNVKLGLGYALIAPYKSSAQEFKSLRHRLMADATGTLHIGVWRLSLKERLQLTHRTGDFNVYQNPTNLLNLKSRLTVKYKGFRRVEPFAYAELRHVLNAPVIEAYYDGSSYLTSTGLDEGEPGWFLSGFNGAYLNRLRISLGTDIRLDRNSTLTLYLLADRISDKVVDANAEGTKLKSYTHEKGFVGWVGASYEYSF